MHQPCTTSSTEEAFCFPITVRPGVCCDRFWEWSFYLERGEDGGHAVGGGALVAAFGAVADDELLGGGEGGGECYEGALAAAFHCC